MDFGHGTLAIHDAKSDKHRLQSHLATLREKHRQDIIAGDGEAHMPESLAPTYPNAPR